MKKQIPSHIEKQLLRFGASPDAPEYGETRDKFVAEAEELFDRGVSEGKSDLDSYREAVEKVMPGLREAAAGLKPPAAEEEPGGSEKDKDKRLSSIEGAAHSAFWLITAATYFVVSFLTHRWGVTWVIFLCGAAGSSVIDAVFAINRGEPTSRVMSDLSGTLWLVVLTVYFTVSLLTHKWKITWIILVIGALASVILESVRQNVKSNEKRAKEEGGGDSPSDD